MALNGMEIIHWKLGGERKWRGEDRIDESKANDRTMVRERERKGEIEIIHYCTESARAADLLASADWLTSIDTVISTQSDIRSGLIMRTRTRFGVVYQGGSIHGDSEPTPQLPKQQSFQDCIRSGWLVKKENVLLTSATWSRDGSSLSAALGGWELDVDHCGRNWDRRRRGRGRWRVTGEELEGGGSRIRGRRSARRRKITGRKSKKEEEDAVWINRCEVEGARCILLLRLIEIQTINRVLPSQRWRTSTQWNPQWEWETGHAFFAAAVDNHQSLLIVQANDFTCCHRTTYS